eukprot:CAMPEP_0180581268 /NCGR_PEP_ID=MMETSP1037_2-20121125/13963_1 /TAXON_ID=632150 /ORGANISM="Azadinium spinosum, Strain 3D9" /LENGTH=45 /DNA_ID= /DNA_START= /DNA_END= /DNA_ORIENTATION=
MAIPMSLVMTHLLQIMVPIVKTSIKMSKRTLLSKPLLEMDTGLQW